MASCLEQGLEGTKTQRDLSLNLGVSQLISSDARLLTNSPKSGRDSAAKQYMLYAGQWICNGNELAFYARSGISWAIGQTGHW